jgi:phage terminase large subunit-like protein
MISDKKLQDLIKWHPHPGQEAIIKSKARDIAICAGRRWGKSAVSAYLALREFINAYKQGKSSEKIWIVAPCVDKETEILSQRGWLQYDELKVGDIVLTLNKLGKAEWQKCQKVNVFEKEGKMVEIKLRGHNSLTTHNHKWLVGYTTSNTKEGKPKTLGYRFVRTKNLTKPNEYVLGSATVLNLPKKKTIDDNLVELIAWYWTEGSDNGNGINISQNRGEKADRIRKAAFNLFRKPQERGNRKKVDIPSWTDWRKQYKDENNDNGVFYFNRLAADTFRKIAPNKIVKPEFINLLTKEQLDLFIDVSVMADGYKRVRKTKSGIEYVERTIIQRSKDRLDSVQMIAQLAGYETTLLYNESKDMWALRIFERNKHWLGQNLQSRKEVDYKGIVWCPTTPNQTWLARRKGTVYFTGNSYELTQKVFEYFLRWIIKIEPKTQRLVSYRPFPQIKLSEGFWVQCKSAENPQSLLGEGLDLLVVDEAAQVNRRTYEQYIFPTTTDRKGRTVFISTPFGQNWFYQKWMGCRREADGESFQFKTKDNPYFPSGEWERTKKLLPEQVFNQEYEASFLPDAAAVFRGVEDIIKDNAESDVQREHRYVMGVDLGKHEDFTVLTVIDKWNNNVVYWDRFKQIDYPFQKKRIKATAERYNKARIYIDSTGVGEPIFEDLRRDGMFIDDFKFTKKSKKDLVEKLSIFMEQKLVFIPNNDILIDELKSFGYHLTDSGNVVYKAPQGLHDDAVFSLALAVWGLTGKANQPTPLQRQLAKAKFYKPQDNFI